MDYYVKSTPEGVSQKRLELYLKQAEIIQWGRRHPVKFVEHFYGIELLDYQKYVFMNSWVTPKVCWCFSRNGAKTTLGSIFIMAKANLTPKHATYIMAGSGNQSQELFLKIEEITKRINASFGGTTDMFFNETVKTPACTTGFAHNPASFSFDLYNGSKVRTLNSDYDNNRGRRSNLNFYDESGFADKKLFDTSEPFIAQNSSFVIGGKRDLSLIPKRTPNQAIYASSASSTDTYFWSVYRDFSKKMLMGDRDYFVADISCDVVMKATLNGVLLPQPLLTQEVIDSKMRDSKEIALREFYNKFTTDGGDQQVFKRASIVRNSESYAPIFTNDTGKRRFALAYDPAHRHDNSVVMVAEYIFDKNIGWYMRIVNSITFLDIAKKTKRQMRTPEQIEIVKQMMLDYNGNHKTDYEDIDCLLIDAGAGGGGFIIADYLMEDWVDKKGVKHKGLIDKEYSAEHVPKFPNAVDKIVMRSPAKYKVEMFNALKEMMDLDLIKFPKDYDMKGFIYINKDTYTDDEVEIDGEKVKQGERELVKYKLSPEEEMTLKHIDLAKEELVNIYRYETGNTIKYDLPPDKKKKMHDDRAYCMAMLAWHLQCLRREHITGKEVKKVNVMDYCLF